MTHDTLSLLIVIVETLEFITEIDVAGMYWCGFRLPKFTWNLSAQLMQQSQDHVKIYKVEAKLHLLLEP